MIMGIASAVLVVVLGRLLTTGYGSDSILRDLKYAALALVLSPFYFLFYYGAFRGMRGATDWLCKLVKTADKPPKP